jgi:hypothetical protein
MKDYSGILTICTECDYVNDDIGFPIENSEFSYMDDNYSLRKRELIKHVEGRDILGKYGQYGCKKLNKRNKKKPNVGVAPNLNIG